MVSIASIASYSLYSFYLFYSFSLLSWLCLFFRLPGDAFFQPAADEAGIPA